MVEDSVNDAGLLLHELRLGGYEPCHERIETSESLSAALARERWDVVLLDFTLPRFSGKEALEMVKASEPDLPCIYVSDTLGEDAAVAAMRSGARDYITKSNLKRLLPAIDRELREAGERRERRRVESELHLVRNIALAVTQAADVPSALGLTLRLICEATVCDAARAWVPRADDGCLEAVAEWCEGTAEPGPMLTAKVPLRRASGASLPERVWAAREPLWQTSLADDDAQADFLRGKGMQAALAVPVLAETEVVAVLELFVRRSGAREENLLHLLSAVVAQLGGVVRRKRAEVRASYLAQYDVLTALPNRALLNDRLRQALVDAHRRGRLVGVASIGLDRFKAINDTLGHTVGDLLLQSAAQRLCACVREGDTVARMSGDEFAVVLGDMAQTHDAARMARKLVEVFASPFELAGHELFASCSAGIALFPGDATAPEGLLCGANSAMARVKEVGGNAFQFYRPEMTHAAAQRLILENGLRRAVDREELLLQYQPKVDLASGAITGVEALVRWQPPHADLVAPLQFVPLAEETGLIVPIGEWVLQAACTEVRRWQDSGLPPVNVNVNLSARQLREPDLPRTVAAILERTGLPAQQLEIEITESLLMQNNRRTVGLLHELSTLGLKLVLDDFGTGYASLAYLKCFPMHALKIDPTFTRGLPSDSDNSAIVRAVIVLAHSLGMKVVAEGVETPRQLEFLRLHRCDEVQGFLFGEPFTAADAPHRLRTAQAAVEHSIPLRARS